MCAFLQAVLKSATSVARTPFASAASVSARQDTQAAGSPAQVRQSLLIAIKVKPSSFL